MYRLEQLPQQRRWSTSFSCRKVDGWKEVAKIYLTGLYSGDTWIVDLGGVDLRGGDLGEVVLNESLEEAKLARSDERTVAIGSAAELARFPKFSEE